MLSGVHVSDSSHLLHPLRRLVKQELSCREERGSGGGGGGGLLTLKESRLPFFSLPVYRATWNVLVYLQNGASSSFITSKQQVTIGHSPIECSNSLTLLSWHSTDVTTAVRWFGSKQLRCNFDNNIFFIFGLFFPPPNIKCAFWEPNCLASDRAVWTSGCQSEFDQFVL